MKRKRANPADVPWCIVVHAGAGQHSRAREGKYCAMMQRACEVGRDALLRGGGSTAAVEAAVAVLEDDPAANAGLGSNLTIEGTVECDASVMEGAERTFGACGAVAGVRNPIALAARVLRQQQGRALSLGRVHPVMLVSDGARRWAEAHDVPVCPAAALVTPEARARWEGYRRALCPSEQGKGEGEGEGPDRRSVQQRHFSSGPTARFSVGEVVFATWGATDYSAGIDPSKTLRSNDANWPVRCGGPLWRIGA